MSHGRAKIMEYIPCRLCLEMITETNFVLLEDFEKNMLMTLIPVVNLDVSCDTKMCDKCTKMLQTSYDFKALCLDNNERVKKLLILQEAFQVSNCKACCLCGYGIFEELDDEFAINWKEMVEICILELDIYSSESVSACEKCVDHLKDLYKFVNKCLKTEKTIKRYSDSVAKNSEGKVKLCDILKTENDSLTAINNGDMLQHEQAMESTILASPTTNNDAQATERHEKIDNVSQSIQNNNCLVENPVEKGSSDDNFALSCNCGTSALNNEALGEAQFNPTLMECSTSVEEVLGPENSGAVRVAQLVHTLIESSTGTEEVPEPERCDEIANISQTIQSDERLVENSAEKGVSNSNSTLTGDCGTSALNNEAGTLEEAQLDPTLMGCSTNVEAVLGPENSDAVREAQLDPTLIESSTGTEEVPEPEKENEINTQQGRELSTENSGETLEHSAGNSALSKSNIEPTQEGDSQNNKDKSLKKFQCDKCSYGANSRAALVSHWMSHKDPSETTMFKCHDCGHETKRKGDLKAHMIIHKNPQELNMFKCSECPYESKRKCDLKHHSMSHQPQKFKCKLCSFATSNEFYLNTVHILTHKDKSEVKMYKCNLCPYEAKIKQLLTRHVNVQKTSLKYLCSSVIGATTKRDTKWVLKSI